MGKIIELSQHVADQIAAGEVVERPASVVKELLENALDAGAKNIEVRIKDGGFDHLIISDDGSGMDEDDVRLAIKRYATSKLSTVSDLNNLHTFGFRGEALPSIASISIMSIATKMAHQDVGVKALIEGGTVRDVYGAQAALGTRIEVRDLFYNVPARLKFARSHRSEASEIDRLLRSFAFVHRHIGFKFFSDNQLIFSTSDDGDHFKRAVLLLGRDSDGHLHHFENTSELIAVTGVLASPLLVRKDARNVVLFVNHRLVSDRKLLMAIKTAYRSLLEVGRSPACALNISIAPDLVDVNVHPRKAEVRFADERRVMSHLIGMIGEFLAKTPWLRSEKRSAGTVTSFSSSPTFGSFSQSSSLTLRGNNFDGAINADGPRNFSPSLNLVFTDAAPMQKTMLPTARFSDLKVVGQICATYLITESEKGLVVIDQHAAHERIMYERFRREKPKSLAQPLLIPITVLLDFADMSLLSDHLAELFELGIEIEIFGKDAVIIRALPGFLLRADMSALLKDIVNDLSEWGRAEVALKLYDHLCATLACHASIRAGQILSNDEIKAILHDLDDTEFHAHCPHGRPIVKSFSDHEIKKWFDRN